MQMAQWLLQLQDLSGQVYFYSGFRVDNILDVPILNTKDYIIVS
jgi:hypothetical protein